jgi:CDGSH iron-sulfur domain-containing protein 3
MAEPLITQTYPYKLELDAGEYWWCACGRSASQPFCDGSHEGTGIEPRPFSLANKDTVWLCGCRHSQEMPFCDGAHKTLRVEEEAIDWGDD